MTRRLFRRLKVLEAQHQLRGELPKLTVSILRACSAPFQMENVMDNQIDVKASPVMVLSK